MEEDDASVAGEDDSLSPVERVVVAAHAGDLTWTHLKGANVVVPDDIEDKVLDNLSDLIADSFSDPTTTEELVDLLETAQDNVIETMATSATLPPDPTNRDFDADEECPPASDVPDNITCRCESAISGIDQVKSSRGKLCLRLHFFFGSGNIEIRVTEGGATRGDVVPMESVYALWMAEDIVHLVLSCPSTARKLKDGRWREASELSMFPNNNPVISIKVKQEDIESASAAVTTCRRIHTDILLRPTRLPQAFTDDELIRRAADFRSRMVHSRMSSHIRAFVTRNDPNASDDERTAASALIKSLVAYCNKHWRLYVDTILKKTRRHSFPLRCLSCADTTRWQAKSGLRVGSDGKDHQYCKKFSSSILPSMKNMLSLPTIHSIWQKIRKSFDPTDPAKFMQRVEAKKLAADLGYLTNTEDAGLISHLGVTPPSIVI